jgi:hypothetical protein
MNDDRAQTATDAGAVILLAGRSDRTHGRPGQPVPGVQRTRQQGTLLEVVTDGTSEVAMTTTVRNPLPPGRHQQVKRANLRCLRHPSCADQL